VEAQAGSTEERKRICGRRIHFLMTVPTHRWKVIAVGMLAGDRDTEPLVTMPAWVAIDLQHSSGSSADRTIGRQ
jgi:hypothetical protein